MQYDGVCAEPDNLPSEPGGYSGYSGLFGHVYVAGAICPQCPVTNGRPTVNDLNGNAMTGFPGFSNISAAQTLGYVAQMLENGVPVVFSYISDLHDCHSALTSCTLTDGYYRALGPGESEYETQIQAYNQAFGEFFTRLQNDGIDSSNTLFIITADEQDHFVAGPPAPAGCDGVNTPCTYTYPQGYTPAGNDSPPGYNLSTGEVQGDLTQLYQQQFPSLVPPSSSDSSGPNSGLTASGLFDYHYDMAPAVTLNPYLSSNTPAYARQLERATAQLTAPNPITMNTDHLTNYLVDKAGLNALHMITGDPLRTPTFVMFANTSWYFQEQAEGAIVTQEQDYAYNHGGVAPEINTTWLGMVGPGVANNGVDSTTWTDHTDTRATLLYLTGLTDDYQGDGRVLVEDLVPSILPASIQSNLESFEQLAAAYKQMNAPVGAFGQSVLQGSTVALASGNTGSDSLYTAYENNLNQLTTQRNALATSIKNQLYGLEFQGAAWNPVTASTETTQANSIRVQGQLLLSNQNTSSASFGQLNVGTAAPIQTLTYNFASPTSLSAVNILTAGQSSLDYTDGGSSTCTAGTAYLSGQSCTVTVAFTPSAAGLRPGAVTLFEQGNNLPFAVWYLNGTGQSSAVTIDPGTQTTLATLANNGQASGVAVDGAGNVYLVDNANSQVLKLAAGTFNPTTVVSSGLTNPTALALDGAGNLYISNTGANQVVLVPNEEGTLNSADMTTPSVTGLGSPSGLAVDGSGDLFVADSANGQILENPAGGGATIVAVSGLTNPSGLAVDNSGNLYVSAGNNQVIEYPAGGGSSIPIGSGFNTPAGLAVDASGAVYVADSGNNRIVRVAPGGASQSILPATGVSSPQGLAVDASANVYFTQGGSAYQINRTQAALTFPNTNVDSVSAAQSVTASNIGNQTLNFSNLAASANFTVVPSGGTNCTSSTQLASALQCQVAVEFAPTTANGPLTGTLTLSDNALNNSSSTQTVQLSGNATQVGQTINFPTIPTQTYGGPAVTLNATASSGLVVSYSVTAGPASVSGNTLTITGVGSVTVQAIQPGNVEYSAAPPVSQTFTVNPATATVALSNLTQTYTGSALSPTVATTPSGLSYNLTGAPDTNAGSYAVTATVSNPNYTGSASGTFVINKASQTITVTTPAPATATAGSSFTIVASASSGLPVTFTSSGVCTNTAGEYTMNANAKSGTCEEAVAQAGNSNYSRATSVIESTTLAAAIAPTVSFTGAPSSAAYGSAFTVTAASNETGAETSVATITTTDPTVCSLGARTVNGTTATVPVTILTGSGTCNLTATWAANDTYAAATAKQTTKAEKVTPIVSFTGAPSSATNGTSFTVTATSNETGSGAEVPTITASPAAICGVGTVTGSGPGSYQATVTITKATGTCTTKAKWASSADYAAASLNQTTTAQ
jgi:sugar lactone lactonase YvrE